MAPNASVEMTLFATNGVPYLRYGKEKITMSKESVKANTIKKRTVIIIKNPTISTRKLL